MPFPNYKHKNRFDRRNRALYKAKSIDELSTLSDKCSGWLSHNDDFAHLKERQKHVSESTSNSASSVSGSSSSYSSIINNSSVVQRFIRYKLTNHGMCDSPSLHKGKLSRENSSQKGKGFNKSKRLSRSTMDLSTFSKDLSMSSLSSDKSKRTKRKIMFPLLKMKIVPTPPEKSDRRVLNNKSFVWTSDYNGTVRRGEIREYHFEKCSLPTTTSDNENQEENEPKLEKLKKEALLLEKSENINSEEGDRFDETSRKINNKSAKDDIAGVSSPKKPSPKAKPRLKRQKWINSGSETELNRVGNERPSSKAKPPLHFKHNRFTLENGRKVNAASSENDLLKAFDDKANAKIVQQESMRKQNSKNSVLERNTKTKKSCSPRKYNTKAVESIAVLPKFLTKTDDKQSNIFRGDQSTAQQPKPIYHKHNAAVTMGLTPLNNNNKTGSESVKKDEFVRRKPPQRSTTLCERIQRRYRNIFWGEAL